jgi:hypothetical protein
MAGLLNAQAPQQGMAQPGMAPGGAPPGMEPGMEQGPPQGGMSGAPKQATPEQQEVYNRFVAQAMNLMYDKKTMPKLTQLLEGGGDPIEGLARATVLVTARVATAAEEAGEQLDGDVLFNAGAEIFNQLADVSDAAGLGDFANDRDALESAYFRALDEFRELMEGAGRIDQATFQRDLQAMQAQSESGEFEQQLRSLAENDPRMPKGEGPQAPQQPMMEG